MTPTKSLQNSENSISQEKMNALGFMVALRIDELLESLDVFLQYSGNKLIGPCPIHGSTRHRSFNMYPEGESVPGYWVCRSHHCERIFKPTIIGFTRGVLSHQQGWEKSGQPMVTFAATLNWLTKFVGQELSSIKIDPDEVERRRFAAQVHTLTKTQIVPGHSLTSQDVRQNLKIPARFFLERGFSPEILDKYDVGLCDKQGKEMSGRVVVPVYDDKKLWLVGCLGRSTYPECSRCETYHNPVEQCPLESSQWLFAKWKNSKNFDTSQYLYNYWSAKRHIQESKVVVLVEGPGDVWRLEEAGIHNAVALFGCELHDPQQILLETSGAMSVVLLLDNDDPGRYAKQVLKDYLNRFYKVYIPDFDGKDVGELSVEVIRQRISPLVQSLEVHLL